jgi:hypothetical protein
MTMRTFLRPLLIPLALAASLVLGGCGDDADEVADDPTTSDISPSGSASGTPTDAPADGEVDFTEIALVSESAVDGESASEPVVLDTEQARADFAARFTGDRMGQAIDDAVAGADVPDGQTLVGAVVSIGCVAPDEVFVEETARGLEITAGKVAGTKQQCFAPVTTVALVAVDSSLV